MGYYIYIFNIIIFNIISGQAVSLAIGLAIRQFFSLVFSLFIGYAVSPLSGSEMTV